MLLSHWRVFAVIGLAGAFALAPETASLSVEGANSIPKEHRQ